MHLTLLKITRRLDELGVLYATAGAMALFAHGYRRFTEDVDLLVTRAGLSTIHEKLDGLGYLPPFQGSRNLRDAEHGVKIEFIVTGEFPGDGKPKPVAFPSPDQAAVVIEGTSILKLATLVELKLASGTAPWRRKDLADVQELIRLLKLPADYGLQLNPFVRELYSKLWSEIQSSPPEQ